MGHSRSLIKVAVGAGSNLNPADEPSLANGRLVLGEEEA